METLAGAAVMLAVLADIFLTIHYARADSTVFSRAIARGTWRVFRAASRRLRDAHVETIEDERAGADAYVALRAQWSPIIERLAPAMGYSIGEIDLPAADPAATDRRPEFRARLRSAG